MDPTLEDKKSAYYSWIDLVVREGYRWRLEALGSRVDFFLRRRVQIGVEWHLVEEAVLQEERKVGVTDQPENNKGEESSE